ncbi:MAG: alcohol dehydrogenase catalytic domain-containing protein [Clostridiales bacterium]|nr:alcohol dehydrogenase catalytic domain-containing protein [Clostridiales bacterium]
MLAGAVTKIGHLNDPDESKRGVIGLVEMPDPEPGDNEVLIKVGYCSICGSDPHTADGSFGPNVPIFLGHEVSGVVAALGKNATIKGLQVGDRIAGNFRHTCGVCYYCQNGQPHFCIGGFRRSPDAPPRQPRPGMAPYMVWNESQVFKLPDNVSLKQGCILEPLSIAVRAGDKVANQIGVRACVSGGGPIGQLTLQVLKLQGGTSLTMIEPIADRRDLAQRFGAEFTIDPVNQNTVEEAMKITGGLGFDVVVEVSGSPYAAPNLPPIMARGGTLMYGAMYPTTYEMPFNLFEYMYRKDLTLTGLFLSPHTFPRSVQLLSHIDLEPFLQSIYPLEQIKEAFDMHMSGKYPKVIVNCNADLADL